MARIENNNKNTELDSLQSHEDNTYNRAQGSGEDHHLDPDVALDGQESACSEQCPAEGNEYDNEHNEEQDAVSRVEENAEPERPELKVIKSNVVRFPQKVDDEENYLGEDQSPDEKNRYDRFLESLELFRVPSKARKEATYASAFFEGVYQTFPVSSDIFEDLAFLELTNDGELAPSEKEIKMLRRQAAFFALKSQQQHHVFNRFHFAEGTLLLDLYDQEGNVVVLTSKGWEVQENTQYKFIRFDHMLPLPEPDPTGDVLELLDLINVEAELDKILVVTWLVTALLSDIPRPILALHGEPGSGKTTTARFLRGLIDPSRIERLQVTGNPRDFPLLMQYHAIPFLDNETRFSKNTEDLLCSAVTGTGVQVRKLYSSYDTVVFTFKKPLIITALEIPTGASDLLDRTLSIKLRRFDGSNNLTEEQLHQQYEQKRAKILGGMLNVLSRAIGIRPNVNLGIKPRLVDWALWGAAVAEAIGEKHEGFSAEKFEEAYTTAFERSRCHIPGKDAGFLSVLLAFLEEQASSREAEKWRQVSEFYRALVEFVRENEGALGLLPKSPNWLSNWLRALEVPLQEHGWQLHFSDNTKDGRKLSFSTVPTNVN